MTSLANVSKKTINITIDKEILKKFREVKIGVLLSRIEVKNPKKGAVYKFLSNFKQEVCKEAIERGITPNNYRELGVCASWRDVYKTFQLKDEKVSTIENLLRRVSEQSEKIKLGKKADLGRISNFVDLYNCISIRELTPMGALDASKVDGDIELRFGKKGELFIPLGSNDKKAEEVTEDHIVYADNSSILTWLWNYRDARHCAVPAYTSEDEHYTYILLFADQAHQSSDKDIKKQFGNVEKALVSSQELIPKIGGEVLSVSFLDKDNPKCCVNVPPLHT